MIDSPGGPRSPDPGTASPDISGPVQPQASPAGIGHQLQPLAAALGRTGSPAPGGRPFARQPIDDALAIRQRKVLLVAAATASPQVSNTISACAPGRDLRVEVLGHRRSQLVEQAVHQRRLVEHHHSLERAKVLVLLPGII